MERSIFWVSLRERAMVPLAGLVLTPILFHLPAGEPNDPGTIARAICGVIGVFLAAMLGGDLPQAGPGGWTFQLARPVPRRRLVLLRVTADLVALVALAVAFVFLGGSESTAWYLDNLAVVGVGTLACLVVYGVAAGVATFGVPTLGVVLGTAVALGLCTALAVWVAATAGNMSARMVLVLILMWFMDRDVFNASMLEGVQAATGIVIPLLVLTGLGLVFALWALQVGPSRLSRAKLTKWTFIGVVGALSLEAAAVQLLSDGPPGSVWSETKREHSEGDQPMRWVLGTLEDESALIYSSGGIWIDRLIRQQRDGTETLVGRLREAHTLMAVSKAPGRTAMLLASSLKPSELTVAVYEHARGEVHETIVSEKGSADRTFSLSSDGERLLYAAAGNALFVKWTTEAGPGSLLIADLGPFRDGGYQVFWSAPEEVSLLLPGEWRTLSASDGHLIRSRRFDWDSSSSLGEVWQIPGGHLLLEHKRLDTPKVEKFRLLRADGSVEELGTFGDTFAWVVSGSSMFSAGPVAVNPVIQAWSPATPKSFWQVTPAGRLEKLGSVETDARIVRLIQDPSGKKALALVAKNREGLRFVAQLKEGTLVPVTEPSADAMFWPLERTDREAIFNTNGGKLVRIPWGDASAFKPSLPSPEAVAPPAGSSAVP